VSTPEAGAARTARRVVVSGRVQGVFFRNSCARQARSEGVDGWVRNRADGRVEVWLEGHPQAVENLVAWCRQGPAHAQVTGVEVTEDSPAGLEGFRIQ
jgi:acylphosphatase